MKKSVSLIVTFFLLLAVTGNAEDLSLPRESSTLSLPLAEAALMLCSGHTQQNTQAAFAQHGIDVLSQVYYDKADDDPSHTVAYTIGTTTIAYGDTQSELVVIAIRGTNAGEWYANFDFAPSHSDEAMFAENFLFAAQDVYLAMKTVTEQVKNPVFLICGHSRGAAAANLLSLLVSAEYGEENVYAYTFATPMTVRAETASLSISNTFNFINPADLVPRMPLAEWGYRRLGTDIYFDAEAAQISEIDGLIDSLATIAPSISAYYNERHSLTGSGLSEDGLTAYEVMLLVAKSLAQAQTESAIDGDMPDLAFLYETDFRGLAEVGEHLAADDGAAAERILSQHMPDTYAQLLKTLNINR